ncbi:protein of unknown function UPF0060 (plasmid) [Methylobacterium aquaticum]|jgi:small multidrug resistance family-3 protein|uniref:Uncharacterized protein n=1 Tax=Methylobacterium aquaticum TaxID=270351 RepID=A0A0C6FQR5_9HYPH|nr:protein of unknown function UPF0060 [Methylobacterium aquaticum]
MRDGQYWRRLPLSPFGGAYGPCAQAPRFTYPAFAAAALAKIAGCFASWAWLRLDKSPWWLIPGMASLALFAYLLTFVETEAAGRAYAAYGGI